MNVRLTAALDLGVKVLAVALALYPLLDPNSSHFQGKAMGVRAFVYPLATVAIPLLWWSRRRPSPYPFLADVALVLPFAFDAAGNVFGWFAIAGFDLLPHSLGWLCLAVALGLAVEPLAGGRWTTFGLAVGFGAITDILWELGEFLLQRSGSSGLQLTYANTIQDLAMSLLGATIGAVLVVTVLRAPPGRAHAIFGWSPTSD